MPLVIGFFADYALEEPLKVCLWIDAVEPATLHERKDEGCIFSSILTFPYADSADLADFFVHECTEYYTETLRARRYGKSGICEK